MQQRLAVLKRRPSIQCQNLPAPPATLRLQLHDWQSVFPWKDFLGGGGAQPVASDWIQNTEVGRQPIMNESIHIQFQTLTFPSDPPLGINPP
jgi:hypothetical protein